MLYKDGCWVGVEMPDRVGRSGFPTLIPCYEMVFCCWVWPLVRLSEINGINENNEIY